MKRELRITEFRIDYSTADIESGIFVEIAEMPVLVAGELRPETTGYAPMVRDLPVTAGRAMLGSPPKLRMQVG